MDARARWAFRFSISASDLALDLYNADFGFWNAYGVKVGVRCREQC